MTLRLFGAFRNLQAEPNYEFNGVASTVGELKAALAREFTAKNASFDAAGLLAKSAVANDTQVLADHDLVSPDARLALLPPVSGG